VSDTNDDGSLFGYCLRPVAALIDILNGSDRWERGTKLSFVVEGESILVIDHFRDERENVKIGKIWIDPECCEWSFLPCEPLSYWFPGDSPEYRKWATEQNSKGAKS
jgi:hypothetical protein